MCKNDISDGRVQGYLGMPCSWFENMILKPFISIFFSERDVRERETQKQRQRDRGREGDCLFVWLVS